MDVRGVRPSSRLETEFSETQLAEVSGWELGTLFAVLEQILCAHEAEALLISENNPLSKGQAQEVLLK